MRARARRPRPRPRRSPTADGHDAAIAAPLAAQVYGLEVLATDIGDNPGAETRFVLVTRPARAARADRRRQDLAGPLHGARTTRARCWRSSPSSPCAA